MSRTCDDRYAPGWGLVLACVLPPGHEGRHKDLSNNTWDDESKKLVTPSVGEVVDHLQEGLYEQTRKPDPFAARKFEEAKRPEPFMLQAVEKAREDYEAGLKRLGAEWIRNGGSYSVGVDPGGDNGGHIVVVRSMTWDATMRGDLEWQDIKYDWEEVVLAVKALGSDLRELAADRWRGWVHGA